MSHSPVLIRGMWGLGDNIFARPFVRAAVRQYRVHLETPWPELYEDLDIRFVLGKRRLRTQLKNIARQRSECWMRPWPPMREITISYGRDLTTMSIINALERRWHSALRVGFDPALFNLPNMGPAPMLPTERPIAVVRPVTVRAEWLNPARNPLPEYVAAITTELMATHTVVVVADLEPGQEWAVGELPPAHHYFVFGQLRVRQLLALVRDADVVVGGVGWIVPAGLALGTRTFVLLGGHGGHNAPERITDPRLDLSRIGFATPENYCKCTNMRHNCDKRITDPVAQFRRWWRSLQEAASHGGRSSASATTRSRSPDLMTRNISTDMPAMRRPIWGVP